ncbi:cytochrome P450 [Peniophora sp. CONT]|nr:cytochrome P450 [Peniophora sp. CONT]
MPSSIAPLIAFAGVSLLVVAVQLILRRIWSQWSLRNIPGPRSDSLIFGNFARMFSTNAIPYQDQLFETYGTVFKINGYLGAQVLVVSDLDALHHIVVKHVDVFDSVDYFLKVSNLSFGPGLLAAPLENGEHRRHRKLMNPAFSIAHMKRLVPLFTSVAEQARKVMAADITRTGRAETDALDYMGRMALELVAQGGFGHSFGALDGEEDVLGRALKRVSPASNKIFMYRPLLPVLTRFFPPWLLRRAGELLPSPALHELFDISDMLDRFSLSVWTEKKQAHAEGKVTNTIGQGRDVLSLLLVENDKTAIEDRLPEKELQAQINTFLFAGTDTTSNGLSRILSLLAEHPNVQAKLREELVKTGAPETDIEYETLDRLPYLEAVCRETLRLFPPVRFVQRQARKDHVLPLRHPITDVNGKIITEVFVPKGTVVMSANVAVNHSKAIWGADALEWKPERWLSPLPQSVQDARIPGVYSNTMTFSGGARACIGFKFSLLEMKSVLAQFIPSFEFRPSEEHTVSWWFGGITSPVIVETSQSYQAKLPLRVTCI